MRSCCMIYKDMGSVSRARLVKSVTTIGERKNQDRNRKYGRMELNCGTVTEFENWHRIGIGDGKVAWCKTPDKRLYSCGNARRGGARGRGAGGGAAGINTNKEELFKNGTSGYSARDKAALPAPPARRQAELFLRFDAARVRRCVAVAFTALS
ncbi:hypothetical protein EVAR_93064_1 [Eumeta japonica]|uniref:Uncharacterized protein n=1 Tax=Eumeta variegata TaxID=151549 RepID=A0A4C1TG23_EUMVA|nr:hypothetical protein EVAR_93064_1 [Eumeta japonica]